MWKFVYHILWVLLFAWMYFHSCSSWACAAGFMVLLLMFYHMQNTTFPVFLALSVLILESSYLLKLFTLQDCYLPMKDTLRQSFSTTMWSTITLLNLQFIIIWLYFFIIKLHIFISIIVFKLSYTDYYYM